MYGSFHISSALSTKLGWVWCGIEGWRHDIQHNAAQHKGTQHNGLATLSLNDILHNSFSVILMRVSIT